MSEEVDHDALLYEIRTSADHLRLSVSYLLGSDEELTAQQIDDRMKAEADHRVKEKQCQEQVEETVAALRERYESLISTVNFQSNSLAFPTSDADCDVQVSSLATIKDAAHSLQHLIQQLHQLRQHAQLWDDHQNSLRKSKLGLFFSIFRNALRLSLIAHQSIVSGTVLRRPSGLEEVMVIGIPTIGSLLSFAPFPFAGAAASAIKGTVLSSDLIFDEVKSHESEFVVALYDHTRSRDGEVQMDNLERFASECAAMITSKFQYHIVALHSHSLLKFAKHCCKSVVSHALSSKHHEVFTECAQRTNMSLDSDETHLSLNLIVAVALSSHSTHSLTGEVSKKLGKIQLSATVDGEHCHWTDTAVRRHTDLFLEEDNSIVKCHVRDHQPHIGSRCILKETTALELHLHKHSYEGEHERLPSESPECSLSRLSVDVLESYAGEPVAVSSHLIDRTEHLLSNVGDAVVRPVTVLRSLA